ncbi:MAG: radical SAM protein, partial [Odoribacter sp.]|nr:radical SAM protein [Odoribacter sp.]
MKIGLIDVDGHHFPNLALMKLSNYHKQNGDDVEWYNGLEWYDRVYMSKVFSFTADDYRVIQADEVVKGGTGYYNYDELFCDSYQPDYTLYPKSKWYDTTTSYGFLTRGCIRKCEFCIVPKKEGNLRPYMDIEEVIQHHKKAILLDNNVLASTYGLEQIEKIIKLGIRVDFNQGLDCRLVTNDIAKLLSKVKWISYIRFSCDHIS